MARTTLNLAGPVLAELKILQKTEKKSLGQLVSELVLQGLRARSQPQVPPPSWISRPMGQPHVSIEDKDAVYAVLDGP